VRYLLDTDIAISWLRGVERARQRVRTAAREGLGISYVSRTELYDGVYQSTDRETASALRHNVTLLTNNRRDFERIEGLTIESV